MTAHALAGKKILFASFPADGHFNPLTGLAVHLKKSGCEVRWYASEAYSGKLQKLQIPHDPFKAATDVADNDFNRAFPGRLKHRSQIGKLKFDIIHAFVLQAPEYYADIKAIHSVFPFDIMVADCAFTGIPFVKDLMKIPVIAIGVLPLSETSADLPPAGLGLQPSGTFWGKRKQDVLRWLVNRFVFRKPTAIMHRMLEQYGICHHNHSVFDLLIKKSDRLLQSGTPGFEYYRSDLGRNIHFAGSLLPYSPGKLQTQWFNRRLNRYGKIVLVTQGTVEKDVNKLLVPTLEAFKDTGTLVVATTGGSGTAALKAKYTQENIIIEDFIPFEDVMPYADVYITNGGYGGVMLSIENRLPLVVAGVHEGKNEICARVRYFGLGIDLKTEKPSSLKIRKAVEKVMDNVSYKRNVIQLAQEFDSYDPHSLFVKHIVQLLPAKTHDKHRVQQHVATVY